MKIQMSSVLSQAKAFAPACKALGYAALYTSYFLFCVWRIDPVLRDVACRQYGQLNPETVAYGIVTSLIAALAISQALHYMRLSVRRTRHARRGTNGRERRRPVLRRRTDA